MAWSRWRGWGGRLEESLYRLLGLRCGADVGSWSSGGGITKAEASERDWKGSLPPGPVRQRASCDVRQSVSDKVIKNSGCLPDKVRRACSERVDV